MVVSWKYHVAFGPNRFGDEPLLKIKKNGGLADPGGLQQVFHFDQRDFIGRAHLRVCVHPSVKTLRPWPAIKKMLDNT